MIEKFVVSLKPFLVSWKEKANRIIPSCVEISTQAALKEMMLPGLMAVAAPLLCGIILGSSALGGLLAGALVTGVLMAIFMANSGGAWDNAKKYTKMDTMAWKGSPAHKAAVVAILSATHLRILQDRLSTS